MKKNFPKPSDRLAGLLTSFSYLRDHNRALMQTLHGSIDELRQLRNNLQKHHSVSLPPDNSTTAEGNLAERFSLTRREAEVAMLLARGKSNQAIARELTISAHTARHHTQRVLSKLKVHSRGEAAAKIRGY